MSSNNLIFWHQSTYKIECSYGEHGLLAIIFQQNTFMVFTFLHKQKGKKIVLRVHLFLSRIARYVSITRTRDLLDIRQ